MGWSESGTWSTRTSQPALSLIGTFMGANLAIEEVSKTKFQGSFQYRRSNSQCTVHHGHSEASPISGLDVRLLLMSRRCGSEDFLSENLANRCKQRIGA